MVPSDSLFATLDQTFQHIPAQHRTSASDLIREYIPSLGNYGKHLVEIQYPKLFTSECLRRYYSYNGDSKNNLNPLAPVLLQYLQKYDTQFYPDVKPTQAWKAMVVVKINEALRRPMKQNNTVF
jgi:hypothetical protein